MKTTKKQLYINYIANIYKLHTIKYTTKDKLNIIYQQTTKTKNEDRRARYYRQWFDMGMDVREKLWSTKIPPTLKQTNKHLHIHTYCIRLLVCVIVINWWNVSVNEFGFKNIYTIYIPS